MSKITNDMMINLDLDGNEWIAVFVKPKIHALDVFIDGINRKKKTYVGRFADNLSEWDITHIVETAYPQYKRE